MWNCSIGQFQFETLCVSNHTAWRFAEKTRFFRSLSAGRRCAAASCFTFSKGKRPSQSGKARSGRQQHKRIAQVVAAAFCPPLFQRKRLTLFAGRGRVRRRFPRPFDRNGRHRAFSVGNALRSKPYGLAFRGKTRFFRSLRAGRRCAAASRLAVFKGRTL